MQFWGSVAPGCSQTPRLCSWSPHLGSFQGAPSAAPLPRAGKGRGLFLRRLCLAGGLPGVSRALHPPCRQGCLPCTSQLPQHQQVWGSNMELWMDHCHAPFEDGESLQEGTEKGSRASSLTPGESLLSTSSRALHGTHWALLPPTEHQGWDIWKAPSPHSFPRAQDVIQPIPKQSR